MDTSSLFMTFLFKNDFRDFCLPFEFFNSLPFTVNDQNCPSIHKEPLEAIDEQFSNHIDLVINNRKYYTSHEFESLSSYKIFSFFISNIDIHTAVHE